MKEKKEKSDKTSCPICGKIISRRGLFGHLRFAHEKTSDEAHELMGNPLESSHEEIDETIEEKDRIKRIFELINELKKNHEWKKDIEIEIDNIPYILTDEESEDLLNGLEDLEEDILKELEDLGIEFKNEDEENPGSDEEDEENPGSDEEKKEKKEKDKGFSFSFWDT